MVKAAIDRFGRIDILVNNAGASSREKPFLEMTKADWDLDINVNLVGQMNVAQSVIPHMISRKYGRVINTTGGRGIPGISVYGAAKAGVVAWTHALAGEVAQFGVIVNGIAPGLGDTGLTKALPRLQRDQYPAVDAQEALPSGGRRSDSSLPCIRPVQLHGRAVHRSEHVLKRKASGDGHSCMSPRPPT